MQLNSTQLNKKYIYLAYLVLLGFFFFLFLKCFYLLFCLPPIYAVYRPFCLVNIIYMCLYYETVKTTT